LRLTYALDLDRAVEDRLDACALRVRGELESAAAGVTSTSTLDRRGAASEAVVRSNAAARVDKARGETNCRGVAIEPGADEHELRLRAASGLRETIQRDLAASVSARLSRLDVAFVPPTVAGETLTLDLPAPATDFARVRRLIAHPGDLEFKSCDDGSPYMKRLAQLAAESKAAFPGLEVGHDGWTSYGSGARHDDVYLRDADRAELDRFLASLAPADALPPDRTLGLECLTARGDDPARGEAWRTYLLERSAILSGDFIRDAEVAWDPQTGRPESSRTFDAAAARLFETFTERHVGAKLAIVLDDEISSAPVIESKIAGGHARITLGGMGDPRQQLDEAKDLVAVLRTGSLPAKLRLASEQRVPAAR